MGEPFEVTGIQSGDMECWCFLVTEEMFKRVTGQAPDKRFDIGRFSEEGSPYRYKLYPGNLFGYDRKNLITIKIEVADAEDPSPQVAP
jgi:hypothetical protein